MSDLLLLLYTNEKGTKIIMTALQVFNTSSNYIVRSRKFCVMSAFSTNNWLAISLQEDYYVGIVRITQVESNYDCKAYEDRYILETKVHIEGETERESEKERE